MTQRQIEPSTFAMLYHIEKWADGTKLQILQGNSLPYVFKNGIYHYFALRPDNLYHLVMTSSRDLGEMQ